MSKIIHRRENKIVVCFESHEKYASLILCKLPIDITVLILYVGKLYK